MKSAAGPLVVTREEGERVLARVDPQLNVSAWDFYTLPIGVTAPGGRTKLYTAADVALARLFGRMRAMGLPARVGRAALGFVQADLRAALQARGRSALVISQGARSSYWGRVVAGSEATGAPIVVPLEGLLTGIDAAMRAVRSAAPDVWTGAKLESAKAVSSSLASLVATVG